MTETILDAASIAAGNTQSGSCAIPAAADVATIVISGFDSNSTSLDVAVSKASAQSNGTLRSIPNGDSVSGIDASTDGAVTTLTGLEGLEQLEITVTNNAASSTTVIVEEDTSL